LHHSGFATFSPEYYTAPVSLSPLVQKLQSTNAFVVVDLARPTNGGSDGSGADARPPASGEARVARKVLQSSATDLARSSTYTFGAFGYERVGASAGINAEGDAVSDAVTQFVTELDPEVADGRLYVDEGKGVPGDAFHQWRTHPSVGDFATSQLIVTSSVLTAAQWALGSDLTAKTVAIEGAGLAPAGLEEAVTAAGAEIVTIDGVDKKPWLIWGADVDVILAGSKPGALTHQGTDFVKATAIVPWGPIPVTTKAFAQLSRTDTIVVPDFVSLAGRRLAPLLEGDEASAADELSKQVIAKLDSAASHADGLFLGACYAAEAFIESWAGGAPFGRPLAA